MSGRDRPRRRREAGGPRPAARTRPRPGGSARDKLNAIHLFRSVAVAAAAGAASGSWVLFLLTAGSLAGVALLTGDVRPRRR